ncbi:MAG: glycosyltransferase family 39 protein, partial [Acidobacteria bacterium]|nr:glycosyltransferase family 39 protein [Acidobacteriota bacterium]MDW7984495.1 glycosyltransferase family 39 protein [Acidobacteriota bacterium]
MQGERRDVLIIVAFGLVFFVWGNWVLSVTSLDEGRNLDATRHMLQTGDLLVPSYNCRLRFEKPPLLYWTTAVGFFLLGPSALSGRLVSGLSAIALSWATYRIARDFFAPDRARASALVLMTFPHLWVEARAAVPELLMTACMAWGLYAFLRGRWTLGWLALSLACLAKGPVGVVLPLGVYLLWRRDWQWLNVRGLWVFATVSLPWYGLMVLRFGYDYFYKFFIYENILRYTGAYRIHLYPFYYYVPIVLVSSLLYLPALPRLVRTWRRSLTPLLGWFLFVLFFFSLSRSKLHHYILFAYPPLAILWAHATSDRYRQIALALAVLLLTAVLVGVDQYEQRRFVPVAAALIRATQPPNIYFY